MTRYYIYEGISNISDAYCYIVKGSNKKEANNKLKKKLINKYIICYVRYYKEDNEIVNEVISNIKDKGINNELDCYMYIE